MRRTPVLLACLAGGTTLTFAAPPTIVLDVDARELPRRLVHTRMRIPCQPGPLALWYPKWIPGTHAPSGPLDTIGGLRIETADLEGKSRLDEALRNNPGKKRPIFAMMRHTALYDRKDGWEVAVRAAQRQLAQFENLFKNLGDVTNGFPKPADFGAIENRAEYDPQMLRTNLMFGTPDEVIAKLKPYQTLGVDEFTYYASLGLGLKEQKRSLELFCKHVIPAFK